MALLHFEETVSPGENTENEQGGTGKIQGELFFIKLTGRLICLLSYKEETETGVVFFSEL